MYLVFAAHNSPELELQPTPEMEIQPTPPVAKKKVRRKRKQPYDTTTVLSNEYDLPYDSCYQFEIYVSPTNVRKFSATLRTH